MRCRHPHQLAFDLGDAPPEAEQEDPDAFPPGPNYLSRFRRALGHEGIVTDEEVADFQQAIIEWLAEVQADQPG